MPRTGRPKSENPKSERIVIKLEPETKKAFTEKCKEDGLIPMILLRQWILEFLENKKK
jgi:hypothetical protein